MGSMGIHNKVLGMLECSAIFFACVVCTCQ